MADGLRKRKRGDITAKGELNIFEWDVVNFRKAFEKTVDGGIMISPVFVGKSADKPNSFWQIEVWPKEETPDSEEKYLEVFLAFSKELNQLHPVVKARFEIFLLNRNQQEVSKFNCHTEVEFGGENSCWGCSMATHSALFNPTRGFLDDDVLRVQIKVWIHSDQTNESKKLHKCQLQKDFSKLLASTKFSDVTLVVGDFILKAHKIILSCRSPVFDAMFQEDSKDCAMTTVIIEDFDINTVGGMLEFIYTDQVESLDEDFVELVKIAEKYRVGELKVACAKAAILKMSIENVLDFLILGDMYNVQELKYKAMAFINGIKGNPMFSPGNENPDFQKFAEEHPKLVAELYQKVRINDMDAHYSGEYNETIEEMTRITTIISD